MRKRRTREHIIADLSINYVERQFLRSGHTAQRVVFDYGYDLFVQTFNSQGEVEPGYLMVQMKATESLRRLTGGDEVAVTLQRRDVEGWLNDDAPVALILYDAVAEKAYWPFVQEETVAKQFAASEGTTITLRLPSANLVNDSAIEMLRSLKNTTFQRRKIHDTNLQNN